VGACADWLDEEHLLRMEKLDGMPERTLSSVWWPFTQHGLVRTPEIAEDGERWLTPGQQEGGGHGDRLGA